jgi:ribosomal protein S12 methylthiotransferase
MSRIGLVSLGCPKNLVDGEVMMGLVREAGHEITADARDADVIVVNTCAFIDTAKEESVDAILEMAQLKRDGRCTRLVVTGCLAERYGDQLMAEIPEIDAVLGTGDVPQIVGAVAGAASPVQVFRSLQDIDTVRGARFAVRGADGPQPGALRASYVTGRTSPPLRPVTHSAPRTAHREPSTAHREPSTAHREPRTANLPTYLYDASTPRLRATPRHFAYQKIAEGCDYTCAFCIIPTLRGRYRSRSEGSIVAEAEQLAAQGVRELLLISQDTTFFGNDRGERGALGRLLRRLNRVDGIAWIRMLYLYPTTITDDVLDAIAESEKVCRYIDLPLQHASADVLRRMRRPGNREAYTKLLARIRNRIPGVTLRTTMIVGFPGETGADYRELRSFVREMEFDHLGVFTYSHEEGTRAFGLEDDVPAGRKASRRGELMFTQAGIVARKLRARVGSIVPVMIDGRSPDSDLVVQGRTAGQAPEIDSVVILSECDPDQFTPGDIVNARITEAHGYDVVAVPV